ncbi:MAG: TIGR01777 family oxidoreductase [Chitinophagaceae bacterium]|nr:TIGR01777 family oxidoreductase [Chitinophagaceae bacterium]
MTDTASKTILITGGTGLVGRELTRHLAKEGHKVIVLTRNPAKANPEKGLEHAVTYAAWDVAAGTIDMQAVNSADAIVHLAGAGVMDKPWTEAYKQEIVDSRVESSNLLVKALSQMQHKVKVVVSASAIGWYGGDNARVPLAFTEDDLPGKGFLPETCVAWENAIKMTRTYTGRVVMLRLGIVMSPKGGAMKEFLRPLRMFRVAGVMGNGQQVISWIHLQDVVRMFEFAIFNTELEGPFNATAPVVVNNYNLNYRMGYTLYGKIFLMLHLPTWFIKFLLGERSVEILKGSTISSEKIQREGFEFNFNLWQKAVEDLLQRKPKKPINLAGDDW